MSLVLHKPIGVIVVNTAFRKEIPQETLPHTISVVWEGMERSDFNGALCGDLFTNAIDKAMRRALIKFKDMDIVICCNSALIIDWSRIMALLDKVKHLSDLVTVLPPVYEISKCPEFVIIQKEALAYAKQLSTENEIPFWGTFLENWEVKQIEDKTLTVRRYKEWRNDTQFITQTISHAHIANMKHRD